MIVKEYIKEFEKLGLGMFVHFGLYSILGKGEWAKCSLEIPEGDWVKRYDEAIRSPRPSGIEVASKSEDFLLKDGKNYYLFCFDLPTLGDGHVAIFEEKDYDDSFILEDKITSATWMDNGEQVQFSQNGNQVSIHTVPFCYGRNLVVRVVKIVCE